MRRREFITLVGGSAAAWPIAARAQLGERRIGVLMGFADNDEVWQVYLATFRQRLQDLGWTEGRNVRFDYRFTGEDTEPIRIAAEQLVTLVPEAILVSAHPPLSALTKATPTIPTLSTSRSHPVARPFR